MKVRGASRKDFPGFGRPASPRQPIRGWNRFGPGGFTLVEVLVALTVSAILVSTVYGIIAGISVTKDRLDQESEGFHQARTLFSRMSREIRSLHHAPGEEGVRFHGGRDGAGHYFLEMATTAVSPVLVQATGVSQVRYEMRPDPGHGAANPLLMRREKALLPGGEGGGMEHRLSSGIHEFRLRFFDGEGWRDEWEPAEENLPRMVELYLEIETDGVRLPFITAIEIPQG
jgi:general secretion pathway protein J